MDLIIISFASDYKLILMDFSFLSFTLRQTFNKITIKCISFEYKVERWSQGTDKKINLMNRIINPCVMLDANKNPLNIQTFFFYFAKFTFIQISIKWFIFCSACISHISRLCRQTPSCFRVFFMFHFHNMLLTHWNYSQTSLIFMCLCVRLCLFSICMIQILM